MRIIRKPDGTLDMKRRRSWWEMNEAAKLHRQRNYEKYKNAGYPSWMPNLPKGFTCWQFSKDMQIEERLRLVLITDMAKVDGAWEYGALELEKGILRRVPSRWSMMQGVSQIGKMC